MARPAIAAALTPSERDLMAALGDLFETAEAVPVSRRRVALLVDAPLFDRFLEMLDRVETGDGREPDDMEGDTADDEPSLGSGHFPMDQTQWALPGLEDLEDEHDGSEPSLGSLEAPAWSEVTRRDEAGRALGFRMVEGSQEQWGLSGRSDLEDENEHHDEAEHTADAGPAFEMDQSRAVA